MFFQGQQQQQQSYLSDSWRRGVDISLSATAKCYLHIAGYNECNASENILTLKQQ